MQLIYLLADYKYILGLKPDATDEEYKAARKNIESMGGKVTYEFHSTMKAFAFTVPDNTIATKEQPAFVDFLEEDKTGKVLHEIMNQTNSVVVHTYDE